MEQKEGGMVRMSKEWGVGMLGFNAMLWRFLEEADEGLVEKKQPSLLIFLGWRYCKIECGDLIRPCFQLRLTRLDVSIALAVNAPVIWYPRNGLPAQYRPCLTERRICIHLGFLFSVLVLVLFLVLVCVVYVMNSFIIIPSFR
jgi:hypothetical protein